jgi:hypothetical protein
VSEINTYDLINFRMEQLLQPDCNLISQDNANSAKADSMSKKSANKDLSVRSNSASKSALKNTAIKY